MPNIKKETELRVITPNEPGILGRVLGTLANAGVNLKALHAYSDKNTGVFLLLTSDNNKANKCLSTLGYEVTSTPVVTVLIDDRIGAGAEIGALLGTAVVDVNHCYCSSAGLGKALLVVNSSDNKRAYDTLK